MNKEILTCLVIIVFVVLLNFITMKYTKDTVIILCNDLYQFKSELLDKESINKNSLIKRYNEIMDKWKKKYNIYTYYIEHDELEKVETELTSLKANIETEENKNVIDGKRTDSLKQFHIRNDFSSRKIRQYKSQNKKNII